MLVWFRKDNTFQPPVALGLHPGEWFISDGKIAPYTRDTSEGFYQIYYYKEVAHHQLTCDTYAPLLQTVHVQGRYGDMIIQIFNQPDFLPVTKEVRQKDSYGSKCTGKLYLR